MKILQVSQYLAMGGLERCVAGLSSGLAAIGHQTVVAVYEADKIDAALRDKMIEHGVELIAWQKQRGFSLSTLIRLYSAARSRQVRIIHSHDLGALIYSVLLSFMLLRRVKLVHTQHSFVHFRKKISRYVIYEKIFPRFVHALCTVSENVSQMYREIGISAGRINVVPNGIVFPDSFLPAAEARQQLAGLCFGPDFFRIKTESDSVRILLFMGRVVRGKGVERLLSLWKRCPERIHASWRLVIAGPVDDSYLKELSGVCTDDAGRPFFAGATDNPILFYQSSDAFVSLSEQEGMPLAAHEALGCGLPALLTDIAGHRELREWATLLPAERSANDSLKLVQFLNDCERHSSRELCWKQMDDFRRHFSLQEMVGRYVRKYAQLSLIIFLFALPIPFFGSVRADDRPLVTQLVERPEYITGSDWQREITMTLARGESTLLTVRANSFCGLLPTLSANLKEAGLKIKWYGGRPVALKKPSFEGALVQNYIDPLIPLGNKVPCGTFEWLFAEAEVSRQARFGSWSGKLENTLRLPDSPEEVLLSHWKLDLIILPVELPVEWSLPLRAEFTPYFASLAHFGRAGREEGELTRKYIQAMFENRVLPLKAWIKHPFRTEAEREALNFRLSRYPTEELSFFRTVVSLLPEWVRFDIPRSDAETSAERQFYWSRWQEFLDSESEDANESTLVRRMANKPFVYLWDEPVQEEFPALYERASDLKNEAPAISSLVTVWPWDSLQEKISIFSPLLQHLLQYGKPVMRQGNELWSYVSCMSHGCGSGDSSGEPDFVIERNAAYVRVWPWMAEEYGLSAVLYYSVNNFWRYAKTRDPWNDLFDFTGNGDGTLFYPATPDMYRLSEHMPVESLRLKFWKQASTDFEYIKWAKTLNPECFAKIKRDNPIVRDAVSWNRDPRQYQHVRSLLIGCMKRRTLPESLGR
ncbi:MAG: glycosyltransferase [Proteobacteria bacterium]|nr:glycosyltransferase [Pseudomonadota bacterium]